MNNSIKNIAIFIAGAAIGSVVTWKLIKQKYEAIAQEEIDSVKETFAKKEYKTESPMSEQEEKAKMAQQKPSVKEYAEYVRNHSKTDYTAFLKGKSEDTSDEIVQEDPQVVLKEPDGPAEPADRPYVITPEEFGELDGYSTISLTYYADNVLADDIDELVEDVNETVGLDSLTHFGEYEDDSVFVRNDRLRADYEILRENRTYEDWVLKRRQPHSAEE